MRCALVAVDPDGNTLFVSGRDFKVRNSRTRKIRRRLQELLATRKAQKQDTRSVRRLLKRLGHKQRNRTRALPLFEEAAAACGRAKNEDLDAKSAYQLARCLYSKGDYPKAAEAFLHVEATFPQS